MPLARTELDWAERHAQGARSAPGCRQTDRLLEPTQVSNYLPTAGCLRTPASSTRCNAVACRLSAVYPTWQSKVIRMTELQSPAMIRTNIPFRLDRLPWSWFHLLVVIGLGITWILDGLEVTIVGSLGPALQSAETLHLSSANLGAVASFYVVGAVIGALVFGWITDRHGRRLVFYVALIVYLSGVLLSAFAWDFWSFAIFRMVTGLGIGGGIRRGELRHR